ncbi:hypothetical protein BS50DRAFT_464929, partial [Corynespora cassiicola Philippines]
MSAASFSYAQAAKGLSATPTSGAAPTKSTSGAASPAKDAGSAPAAAAATASWADDAEHDTSADKPADASEPPSQTPQAEPKSSANSQPASVSMVSSPDLGASTASTVTKDDDVASLPNASSESTWENKSQASTSVDKTAELVEKTSDKAKAKDVERTPPKPLQEAPVPAVNIWKQRADEAAKAKAAKGPAGKPSSTNGVADTKERNSTSENKWKSRDEEKAGQPKKDAKPEVDSERTTKSAKGRPFDKDFKPSASAAPLLPDRDQESWPTPETAVDEDRKKAQGKNEKVEKERKDGPSGKQEWVKIPYTPTVKFNTPMPGTSTSRRGGRGGGRGGAQGSSRPGFAADKENSGPAALPNGDGPKRGPTTRDASPKDRRAVGAGSPTLKDKVPATGEKSSKTAQAADADASRRPSVVTDSNATTQAAGQGNSYPRQYPSGRPNKGRRGDFFGSTDRRKDGEFVSPTKENGASYDRRTSTAGPTDAADDGDRRGATFQEGQAKQGPNERRPYGSISGRDRPRGGPRGSRGNFQNGYTNGHGSSMQSSSNFALRSPTSFTPEQNGFGGRKWNNGPRSQSVTAENVYHGNGFPAGPQQPMPVQAYPMVPPMDNFIMPPVGAVPFAPFMDPFSLFSAVTMQLDYYFSIDNLLKDMYLRKHMDSKGFVFLSFITDFNRMKKLTTDLELIKLACHQSPVIEFRVGQDGKDRLRRKEGWEQWVLEMSKRDPSAQNEGPEEFFTPPMPHPHGLVIDQNGYPRFPEVPAFEGEGQFPAANGFQPGAAQHITAENMTNGATTEGLNGSAVPNGNPSDVPTKAVS